MSKTNQQQLPTDEEKKVAFEMSATVKIYQLYQLAEVLNLASTRGAFRGPEMSHVGSLFDNLSLGVDKAFKLAKEQLESEAKSKLETVAEGDEVNGTNDANDANEGEEVKVDH